MFPKFTPSRLFRLGFTLVEIMVVVVVIGLLAALAIPAFRASRNTAIEKMLFNDARQISSAANMWFAESGDSQVTMADLCGPKGTIRGLSAGTVIYEGKKTAKVPQPTQAALSGIRLSRANDMVFPSAKIISLCHPSYQISASRSQAIQWAYAPDANLLNFAVDTGEMLTQNGCRILSDGRAYATPVDGADVP